MLFQNGLQNRLHPALSVAADVDEQIRVLHTDDVSGCGLKGVGLGTGGEEHGEVYAVPRDLADKIILRENGRDYL
jgi:hypothetical protein